MQAAITYALPPLTNADVESMPDDGNRYELIDGELYVSSAPSIMHQSVLMKLAYKLYGFVEEHRLGNVLPGVGVIFDDFNGVIPDLVFITNERREAIVRDGRLQAAPDIAIEILSPGSSNERRDRRIKRDLYARTGVGEYWLVDPANKRTEVHIHKQGTFLPPVVLPVADELSTALLPGFSLSLKSLF